MNNTSGNDIQPNKLRNSSPNPSARLQASSKPKSNEDQPNTSSSKEEVDKTVPLTNNNAPTAPVAVNTKEWIECFDPKSQRKYYYNTVLKKSTWKNPFGSTQPVEAEQTAQQQQQQQQQQQKQSSDQQRPISPMSRLHHPAGLNAASVAVNQVDEEEQDEEEEEETFESAYYSNPDKGYPSVNLNTINIGSNGNVISTKGITRVTTRPNSAPEAVGRKLEESQMKQNSSRNAGSKGPHVIYSNDLTDLL